MDFYQHFQVEKIFSQSNECIMRINVRKLGLSKKLSEIDLNQQPSEICVCFVKMNRTEYQPKIHQRPL